MNDLSIAIARVRAARKAHYTKPPRAARPDMVRSPRPVEVAAPPAAPPPSRDAAERPQRDLGVGYALNEPLPGEDPASVPQIEETSREPGFLSVTQLTALLMAKGR